MANSLELTQETINTISDPQRLLEELERVRQEGVGTDNEEFIDGIIAVSVPIKDQQGRFYASLALQAPVVRMDLGAARGYISRLKSAAAELATLLEG